jgi:glyoxylase-like metal-dependent hydrolase (beta-lactamase superfamily II)
MYRYQVTIENEPLEIYRFPYEPVDSNMFFVPSGDTGLVFDPNENDELLNVFERYGTKRIVIVLTHEHYDHTNGTIWLQSNIESKLFCQQDCADAIVTEKGNEPKLVAFVLATRDAVDGGHRYEDFKSSVKRYTLQADETYGGELDLVVGNIKLKCYSMPGHTPGSSIYIWGDKYVFTGDSLIQNTPTILRFRESNKTLFETKTRPFLKSLDKNMLVFPGHGEPFKIQDAKYL